MAVFAPDRLSLVKGPPAERRAHLDGFVAARWPSRGELRKRFGQALAQRNAMISRVAAGYGSPDGLDVWDAGLADAAAPLIAARAEAVAELAPPFAAALAELGLEGGELAYAPRAEGDAEEIRAGPARAPRRRPRTRPQLLGPPPRRAEARRSRGRALRKYGSQGQQRAALLALLFAEREALLAARRVTPLLLLDDVMSELDPGRRELLVARLADGGQTLITAADEESLPAPALRGGGADAAPGVVDAADDAAARRGGGVTRRRAPRQAGEAFRVARDRAAPEDRAGGGAGGLDGGPRRAPGGASRRRSRSGPGR